MDIEEDYLQWFLSFLKQCFKSMPNQRQLANELHIPITRKFKRSRVYFSFKTIFGT